MNCSLQIDKDLSGFNSLTTSSSSSIICNKELYNIVQTLKHLILNCTNTATYLNIRGRVAYNMKRKYGEHLSWQWQLILINLNKRLNSLRLCLLTMNYWISSFDWQSFEVWINPLRTRCYWQSFEVWINSLRSRCYWQSFEVWINSLRSSSYSTMCETEGMHWLTKQMVRRDKNNKLFADRKSQILISESGRSQNFVVVRDDLTIESKLTQGLHNK